jgi:PKD repeat protein
LYCTVDESCQAGECLGVARDCTASGDACNEGVCDDTADACVGQPKPAGTRCDDGAYCTVDDTCVVGICTGANRECASLDDGCQIGLCDESAAACVLVPPADGRLCPVLTSTAQQRYLIGVPYAYDDDRVAAATGSQPITWELLEGPDGMRVSAGGLVSWLPDVAEPVSVTLRASNSEGAAEQSFELRRVIDEQPAIVRQANTSALVGTPYFYDPDQRVDLSGVVPGEQVVVIAAEAPPGMVVSAVSGRVAWIPSELGEYPVTLELQAPTGRVLDTYPFLVSVTEPTTEAAVAVAQVEPASGVAPLSVVFDGSESRGGDGAEIVVYNWDFSDSSYIATGEAVVPYTFNTPGGLTATLQIRDEFGATATDKVFVSVADAEHPPPRALIEADVLEGTAPLQVNFHCDCAPGSEERAIASVAWGFGNGEGSAELDPAPIFRESGAYRVRLMVEDDRGVYSRDSVTVIVREQAFYPPKASIVVSTIESEAPVRVDMLAVVDDPDGYPVSYTWSLPDGSVTVGETASATFTVAGYYKIGLQVLDNDGLLGTDEQIILVRIDNKLPPRVVSSPVSRQAVVGESYLYDADRALAAQGTRPLYWSVGVLIGGQQTSAPDGMAINQLTGELVWTPRPGQVGAQRVVLTATNDVGFDSQTLVIEVTGSQKPDSSNEALDSVRGRGCACRSAPAPGAGTSAGAPGDAMVLCLMLSVFALSRRRHRVRHRA